jgi:multidrug efflux pump
MRPGLVVGITIPLVLAVTFLAMDYWGIGLHKISLGSLIIALGLLVDDAIIAVEMMVRKMEEGYDKVRAATFAYESHRDADADRHADHRRGLPADRHGRPRGRIHLRDLRGDGDRAGAQLARSVYFVPYLGTLLLKAKPHVQERRETPRALRHAVLPPLPPPVNWCVEHRWLTIGATVLMFALGIVGMGKVQQQFFPDSSRPEILVDIWFPEGTSFAANEARPSGWSSA